MELLELRLENWGPFAGVHTIPLSVPPSAPVVLFRGENMRGKTSLLRAIVWCLYGQMREQDGRTSLPVERLVNLDALRMAETSFGVTLKFVHQDSEYVLIREGVADESDVGVVVVTGETVSLKSATGQPFPIANIPDVIDGVLAHDISDFFLFDGEMLNRFEERLREERASSQGFVRAQVERALGLPFMRALGADLETLADTLTTNLNQVLRRVKRHEDLSDKYREKKDDLDSKERDLANLTRINEEVSAKIVTLDAELAKVDEVKDLYYERKSLETQVAALEDTIKDYQNTLADHAENTWWLPAAEMLSREYEAAEAEIRTAEGDERKRLLVTVQIENLREQLATGVCPTCGQDLAAHDDARVRSDIEGLEHDVELLPAATLDDARRRRDRLRRFRSAASATQRAHEQEQDLSRERRRADKARQRIREIGEQISGNDIDIQTLEKRLLDYRSRQSRVAGAISGLETDRSKLRREIQALGSQIASQPEVGESERRLSQAVSEAQDVVDESFDEFRAAMRSQVAEATSRLFRRLTTEKEYSGVNISDDYVLRVVDHQGRSLSMISAGANQILTMAFIGALAACSADEAPMVMDTPFGRLDTGHRDAILDWVSGFDRQVILFVQSGEYDPERNAAALRGRVGREFTIDRLSPTQSEVSAV